MQIIWIGQAGLLIDTGKIKIMVDPYLSDSVVKVHPQNWRRVPVKEALFKEQLDVIVLTHDHIDHLDPETLPRFLNAKKTLTVLAPYHAWQKAREFGGNHNYVMFNRGTVWTQDGVTFTAVKAEHSDLTAIGFILDDGREKLYITGDTLYNREIFKDLPANIDVVFLPINGVGNNMNLADAKRFAKKTGAKWAVPIHWGMFDNLDPSGFDLDNAVIPDIYEEVKFK
ncbi:MBL fold metallo-hydrolase [Ructibacterium gallinarum]|uniref:MBL fold metallo-hydrolase n=1 Tax=Ructibacterium gallinarum TaxID=2779355 RepID=A0A9D5LYW4_9FIRM|nr:MBL fold metallo-hydrolase [Ructibacterium gallinarum]MBE5039090.1 MBL fold metallo-hydrolase [Ructibacterium gallinarum]